MSGTKFTSGINLGKADGTNKLGVKSRLVHKSVVLKGGIEASETSTGFTLPAGAIVEDLYIYVHTSDDTETVDIGTDGSASNDPDGFADALSLASTGIVRPGVTATTGLNETYVSANTRGVLLSTFVAGSDNAEDHGIYLEKPDSTSGGDEITYTCSSGTDTAVFDIIVKYSVIETF